jgi:predicted GNAT family N-acyltransferase
MPACYAAGGKMACSTSMTEWKIRIADWCDESEQAAIRSIREQVFVREQAVPEELEWDGLDEECLHLLVIHPQHGALATARLCYDSITDHAHIGRMSVLKDWRLRGIGSAMLQTLIEHADMQQLSCLELNAQTHAVDFYRKFGFEVYGDEFLDAGIPHYRMLRHK